MGLRFILGLGFGSLQDGFPHIIAEVKNNGITSHKFEGSLPPALEVEEMQKRWQNICLVTQHTNFLSRIKVKQTAVNNISEDNPKFIYQGLNDAMRLWLSSESFYRGIEENFRKEVDAIGGKYECFEIFIETKDSENWNLPWDAWKFREDYKNCEIVKSPSKYKKPLKQATIGGKPLPSKGRILCVSGDGRGIDLKEDRRTLQKSLGDRCELEFIKQPTPDRLREKLSDDEKNWQILYYGGHSSSNAINGWLHINQTESDNTVTVDYLKEGLEKSIFKGLELLILNSCSSLKLAEDLVAGGLPLPSTIVMRAPIPDKIAHDFVKSLFRYLGDGDPLFLAVRKAKDDLHHKWESEFPGASAIPVLCQQPTFEGLTLPKLECDPPIIPTEYVVGNIVGDRPNNQSFVFPPNLLRNLGIGLATTASSYMLMGPMLAKVANEIGMKNHKNSQLFIAEKCYKLATLLNLNHAGSYYNLAKLYEDLNEKEYAEKAMKEAARRGSPEANAQISRSLIINNQPQESFKFIASCLEHTKYDGVKAACFKNRGWARFKQKQYDAAEQDLRTAISFKDNSPEAQCLLADVLETKGNPQAALEHWNKAFQYSDYRIPKQDECIRIAQQRLQAKGNIK
jgi:tetratricopeptide (TPR) repeat protein